MFRSLMRVASVSVVLVLLSAQSPSPAQAEQTPVACQAGCLAAWALCVYLGGNEYCNAAYQGCSYGCTI